MLSWAQRTARWTVRSLPFSIGRSGGQPHAAAVAPDQSVAPDQAAAADQVGDEAGPAAEAPAKEAVPATAGPAQAQAADHGSRHRAFHERVAGPSARGRHAAPSRSRRPRSSDAD